MTELKRHINVLGHLMYLRMRPTFPGAKAPVLCAVPNTAFAPTDGQKKARTWLIREAHGRLGHFGSVADAGHGKGGTVLGKELNAIAPGKGAHIPAWREAHYGAKRKRKSDTAITNRLAEYAT